ncbi:choice-of-anchor Q domain-containing protein [Roseiconus nitratireducens]|uniref:choice-of-anchor Q domain-containing protein n=1 Tax=Roseiconus nitratireducens TaxID=2605748 RepID=UPI0013756DC7|nr:choice-of-anchor Q domain-containing protein [Roseiconus nitratireducens]
MEGLERRNLLAAITVNTLLDTIDASDGVTSLREAIIESNANGEADSITLPAGTLTLTLSGSDENAAATGDLDIAEGNIVSIAGDGTSVIDASALGDRAFDIMSGADVELSGITITGGIASDTGGASPSSVGDGGAVYNSGDLTLDRVTLDGNAAAGVAGSGGAVLNAGVFAASDSSITNNRANRAGGGIEDASDQLVTLTNVALDGNNAGVAPAATASPGNGGGLHVTGNATVNIFGGTVSGNSAAREGGGLWNGGGTMVIDGTTISHNTASGAAADDGGGGVFNNGGTIEIENSLVIGNVADGLSGSGGGILNLGGSLAISSTTISGNTANRAGGGIEVTAGSNTTLTNVTLGSDRDGENDDTEGNSVAENPNPGNGGGLHIGGDGVVAFNGGSVAGNRAGSEGGGLWNSSTGTLEIDGTLIDSNSAPTGGGIFNNGGTDVTSRVFTTTLVPLNGSGVSGTASVILDQSSPMNPTISVSIDATGLVPDQPHIQHIHGRFASDFDDSGKIAGPFFGSGGEAVASKVPTASEDVNGDGFITVGEGLAAYGNVLLNLSDPQTSAPPEGQSPLAEFDIDSFPTAPGGVIDFDMTYSFDLSDPDQARQYNNLLPLALREVVLHGVNTDIDVDADGTPDGYRVTGPAAAGLLSPAGGRVTVTGATISNNSAEGNGGGVVNETGTLSIADSTITANASGGDEPGEGGGGIANFGGTLTLSNTEITENTATVGLGNGGGILNNDGGVLAVSGGSISANSAARAGGGVENAGTATFLSTALEDNSTGINGGAFHTSGPWSATFIDATVASNAANAEGGGLWNSGAGKMVVVDSVISGNVASGSDADQGGGGIFNDGGELVVGNSSILENVADGASGSGGGVLNLGGSLAITSTTVRGNVANRAGGGVEATDGSETILNEVMVQDNVAGPSGSAAPGNGGGLHISGAGNATVTGGSVSGNLAASEGGGLWNGGGTMEVTGVSFSTNTASGTAEDNGGGALFNNGGVLIVQDATFENNVADGPRGGGAGVMNVAAGTVTIAGSSFVGNQASGAMMGDGGAAILSTDGDLHISASNFIGNSALGLSGSGGAILARTGNVTIEDSVISGNQANRAGGGIEVGAVSLTLDNVTLGGETVADGNSVAGSGANPGNGGGLHVTFDSDVAISGGVVQNNSAVEGGGLWNSATGTMSVIGTTISDNVATGDAADSGGGGVFNNEGVLTIHDSAVVGNVANGTSGSGGGLFNFGGNMTVTSTVIGGNTANRAGGGIEVTAESSTVLTDVTLGVDGNGSGGNSVETNANPGNGGGLHISGNGLVSVIRGSISGNAAIEGGGLWNSPAGTLTVLATEITDNSAVRGAGVFNEASTTGVVTITDALIDGNEATGNEATDGGGGIHNLGVMSVVATSITNNLATGASGSGGGIANAGDLSLTSSTLSGNVANRAGGGIEALDGSTSSLNNVDLVANVAGPEGTAAPGNGGALHVSGAGNVSLINGSVVDNQAAREGGGLWNGAGVMSINGTRLTGNTAAGPQADDGGGALFNNGGTLSVVNATIRENRATGSSGSGGGLLNLGGTVSIVGTTLEANVANRAGGGIEATAESTTTVLLSNLSSNIAGPSQTAAPGNGGAFHISGNGSVTLDRTVVDSNVAANEGGGLWNSGSGLLEVRSSTISANQAPSGAGLFNDEGAGTTLVTNSTLADNSASGNGGGIGAEGGVLSLKSVTIARNEAASGGGISVALDASVTAINTLVAENTADDSPDLAGSIISQGANLVGDSAGSSFTALGSDLVDVQAQIAELSDNGGPTPTIALLDGSPALSSGVLAGLTTDQRGVVRPQGNGPDIGAFESDLLGDNQAAAMLSISAEMTSVSEGDSGTTPFTFLVTRTGNVDGVLTVDYTVQGIGDDPVDTQDFGGVLPSGTITFADQESSKEVTIQVSGDTSTEADESFEITLSNPSGNATIVSGMLTGMINDDDLTNDDDTQILIPSRLIGPQLIPGNNLPTAILFQAAVDATITVQTVGSVDLRETIRILNGDLQQINNMDVGTTSADVEAGGMYAIIFEPQTMDRLFVIRSNRGSKSITSATPTNILSATDTDGNGVTTPSDALKVINALSRRGEGESASRESFLDVNRDGIISASDALFVVNQLGRQSVEMAAEGEQDRNATTILPRAEGPAAATRPTGQSEPGHLEAFDRAMALESFGDSRAEDSIAELVGSASDVDRDRRERAVDVALEGSLIANDADADELLSMFE